MQRVARLFAAVLLAAAAGCATWSFEAVRSSRFVNEENEYLQVDYGLEEHESTFQGPTGVPMKFRSNLKVRVELPDGTRFVAFQHMSVNGRLYVTDDGRWEFLEHGVAAYVAERETEGAEYVLRYQGTLCANVRNPDAPRGTRRGTTTSVLPATTRGSSGPDVHGPPSFERK